MKYFIQILFLLTLAGCQTDGYFINDYPLVLPEIRKAVNVIIGTPKEVSVNGRELVSEYHDRKFQPLDSQSALKFQDRYTTKVVILGSRRPYEINVMVLLERYENQTQSYVYQGVDDDLSRIRAINIKKALNLSLGKKTGFDGEKPF